MSGVGKGTTTASIGKILQCRGLKVAAMKIDPYINVDAGTMNPVEHGEVFVTPDGDETDMDIGAYERFLGGDMGKVNYMTTGRVYKTVIERERALGYGGKCVEVVPHVPLEVIDRIKKCAAETKSDVLMIEVGGTVGEYQNILFLEAARMMKHETPDDIFFALVSYVPIPPTIGEMKTKPTQYAARTVNEAGIQPDFIICRAERALDEPRKGKLAVGCGVHEEDIFSAPDAKSIYEVPVIFEDQKLGDRLLAKLKLKEKKNTFAEYRKFVTRILSVTTPVKIAVVGKYFSTGDFVLADAYHSVIEALKHAAWFHDRKAELSWINAEEVEKKGAAALLSGYDGILIPGGFGSRGVEGKIEAIRFAREEKIPYLGLCYGMQLAVVEFARHILGWKDANTTEIAPKTKHPVIHIMKHQVKNVAGGQYGGTMRLGAYECVLKKGTLAHKAYGADSAIERHRHRYEFNNAFKAKLEKAGLVCSATTPDGKLVEIIELPNHPFFLGTQAHPEFTSRPEKSQPLFREFIKAAIAKK